MKTIFRIEFNWRSVKFISEENSYNDVLSSSYEVDSVGVSDIKLVSTDNHDTYEVCFHNGISIFVYNVNRVFWKQSSDCNEQLFDGYGYRKMLPGTH